jgi:ketosteroid isomerase-like protein
MDKVDVRQASGRFYQAVNGILGGNPEPMLAIWSHDDDTTYCDTNGEIQRGWKALEAYWRRAAEQNADASVRLIVTAREQAIYGASDLAYTVMVEEVRTTDGSFVLDSRATIIYRREGGEWRVVHRHTDAPPKATLDGKGE